MKKIISSYLVIFLLLALPSAGVAQKLTMGIMAGINGAKFVWHENTEANINDKMGLGGGIYAGYRLNRLVSFRAEALINQKGAEVEQIYTEYNGTVRHVNSSTTRLDYLEFPVMMNFSLPQSYKPVLKLYFGFYGAALLSAEQIVTGGITDGVILIDSSYTTPAEKIKKQDYGLVLGATIPMGKLELGGRYEIGYLRIINTGLEDINEFVDQRNRVLSFIVGYRIK